MPTYPRWELDALLADATGEERDKLVDVYRDQYGDIPMETAKKHKVNR